MIGNAHVRPSRSRSCRIGARGERHELWRGRTQIPVRRIEGSAIVNCSRRTACRCSAGGACLALAGLMAAGLGGSRAATRALTTSSVIPLACGDSTGP